MALGAAPRRVLKDVLGKALALATCGLLLGVAGAVLLGLGLSGFLFRVRPWDPTVMIGVLLVLLLVAGVAVWLPARRAAATDPMGVLRCE